MKVLLLHGMFCTPWHMGRLTEALVLQGFDAHALTLPRPRDGSGEGLRDHVEFVKSAAVEAGGAGSVALVGHSMGGLICLLAAAELADRPWMRKLALLGSAPPAGVNGFNLANLFAFLPAVLGPGARHLMKRKRYEPLFMSRQDEALRAAAYGELVSEPRSLIRSITLGVAARRPRFAAAPRFQSLVLAGAGDRATPPSVQRAIAKLLPGARYECLEESDHYGFVEGRGSREALRALATFLSNRG